MKFRHTTMDAAVTAIYAALNALHPSRTTAENRVEAKRKLREAISAIETDLRNTDGPKFAGADYNPATDKSRLTRQVGRVFDAMSDGEWHTLPSLRRITGDPVASISAQLRHLRKRHFGGWLIDRRRRDSDSGLYYYRMRNPDGTKLPPIRPIGAGRAVVAIRH